mgnify:CR=1 FL=1
MECRFQNPNSRAEEGNRETSDGELVTKKKQKKTKRKRKQERRQIHPRNKYAEVAPDFCYLASLYPSFAPFVTFTEKAHLARIDWTDYNATRELTRTLLFHDFGIQW